MTIMKQSNNLNASPLPVSHCTATVSTARHHCNTPKMKCLDERDRGGLYTAVNWKDPDITECYLIIV